jgi:magnesium-transporting ATPase (P-type)
MAGDHRELRFADVDHGLTLIGLFGLLDPPREEAIEAEARCQAAGIRIKMSTGDHGRTAPAVAAQLGLVNHAEVLSGREIDALGVDALRARAAAVDVFARASPEHKLRLVQSLQAGGQVVAMTGDGVNDAPALKRADVGVAMGLKGTEAAKEAAQMVLADDNFATIAHAVEEGRTVYDNLRKSIAYILPTNGGEGLIIVAAVLLGSTLPITPVQILWINMVTTVTLALALAFEPAESDVMRRAPRRPSEPMLSGFLVWRVAFVAAILLLGAFGLFVWERSQGASVEAARTAAVATVVMIEIAYLFNTRHLRDPVISRAGLLGSRPILIAIGIVLGLQLLFTYAPPLQVLFDTRPISLVSWCLILLVAAAALLVVELEKWVGRLLRHSSVALRPTIP